jgi:hypothetical protein
MARVRDQVVAMHDQHSAHILSGHSLDPKSSDGKKKKK